MIRRALLAAFLAAACSDGSRTVAHTELTIVEPPDGAQVFSRDDLAIHVTASDNHLVKTVVLSAGARAVKTCTADPPTEEFACDVTLPPADVAAQVQDGKLTIRAHSTNADGDESDRSADVVVTSLLVRFTSPAPPGPVTVKGTGPLAIAVRGEVPVTFVQVTYDDGLPLRQWDAEPYEAAVDWPALVGFGPHTLVAKATDASARTAEVRLAVTVACTADGECDRGQHCCAGTCAAACP